MFASEFLIVCNGEYNNEWRIFVAYHVRPRQVHPCGQEALVFDDLHASTGVEHDDDLALIQNIRGSVNHNPRKVLELEGGSVEVDFLTIREYVEPISPLCEIVPQTNLDGSRIVSSRCANS